MKDAGRGEAIREQVRQYYAWRATESECGCQPAGSEACCTSGYPIDLLEQVPGAMGVPSLGCADPVSAAGLQPGEVVLDLGSGAGLDCFLAARQVGHEGKVIGVDMTDEMLTCARNQAEELGLSNVEFRRGLIEALPLEAGSIDVVLSNCVINLSPDKPAVLHEIARVLRPGGRLVVADIVTRSVMAKELRLRTDSWAACIAGALTVDEYAAGLVEAGLEAVAIRPADGRDLAEVPDGVPFSALITARRPLEVQPSAS
ncbi:MAG: methyltransferase domain-containing protein [Chloroflexota bacterium]